MAQAVEEGIAPDAAIPKGCETTVATPFRIGTLENPSLKRRESAQEVRTAQRIPIHDTHVVLPYSRIAC